MVVAAHGHHALSVRRVADAAGAADREQAAKKARLDEQQKLDEAVEQLRAKAVLALEDQLAAATRQQLEALFEARVEEGTQQVVQELLQRQASAGGMKVRREGNEMEWEARKKSGFKGMTVRLEEKI